MGGTFMRKFIDSIIVEVALTVLVFLSIWGGAYYAYKLFQIQVTKPLEPPPCMVGDSSGKYICVPPEWGEAK